MANDYGRILNLQDLPTIIQNFSIWRISILQTNMQRVTKFAMKVNKRNLLS